MEGFDPDVVVGRGLEATPIGRGLEGFDPDVVDGREVNWKWIKYRRQLEGLEGTLIGKTLMGRGCGVVVDCFD